MTGKNIDKIANYHLTSLHSSPFICFKPHRKNQSCTEAGGQNERGNGEIEKIPVQEELFTTYISTGTTHGGQGTGSFLVLSEFDLDTAGNPFENDQKQNDNCKTSTVEDNTTRGYMGIIISLKSIVLS